MNVWYKPRLQSVDNIIKTQVLDGDEAPVPAMARVGRAGY